MTNGRVKAQRSMLVAQAALVWTSASAEALQIFIDSGRMPESGEHGSQAAFPYDADAMRQIVASNRGG